MEYHVAGVDQHPVALGNAFDAGIAMAAVLQLLEDLIGDGAHMPVRPARRHDHMVGEAGLAGDVDVDDILGLGFIERCEDGFDRTPRRLRGRGNDLQRRAQSSAVRIQCDGQGVVLSAKVSTPETARLFLPVQPLARDRRPGPAGPPRYRDRSPVTPPPAGVT